MGIRLFLSLFFLSAHVSASTLSERRLNGTSLLQALKSQGVSELALRRAFDFYDSHIGTEMRTSIDGRTDTVSIRNRDFITIIDFTLPSSQRRFFLIDLRDGHVDKYFVAHGVGSGENLPTVFSNVDSSRQSSLGMYLTGSTYAGTHGESMKLFGLESSNSNAFQREIVMHPASYVSLEFLAENGRMGRSFGCPAVSTGVAPIIIPKIKDGSLYYIHHDLLYTEALRNPLRQILSQVHQTQPAPQTSSQPRPAPVTSPATTAPQQTSPRPSQPAANNTNTPAPVVTAPQPSQPRPTNQPAQQAQTAPPSVTQQPKPAAPPAQQTRPTLPPAVVAQTGTDDDTVSAAAEQVGPSVMTSSRPDDPDRDNSGNPPPRLRPPGEEGS